MLDIVLAFILTYLAFADAAFLRIRAGKSIFTAIAAGMLLLSC